METIYSANQEGDFTPGGVVQPTGELSDVRNPLETQAQNLVQPAIITSQSARRAASKDTAKLRGFREELNKSQSAAVSRPTEVRDVPQEGFTADEVNRVFGGDLSGFTLDRNTNRFVPNQTFSGEQEFAVEKSRKITRETRDVLDTLERIKSRATPSTATILSALQQNYANRARNLRNF